MRENLAKAGDGVFSEAIYVLMAQGGDPDAHERVRKATMRAEQAGQPLIEILRADAGIWNALIGALSRATGLDADEFFSDPARYAGVAAKRAAEIADRHASIVRSLREELASTPR
jgi:adenylosuccinate lyase